MKTKKKNTFIHHHHHHRCRRHHHRRRRRRRHYNKIFMQNVCIALCNGHRSWSCNYILLPRLPTARHIRTYLCLLAFLAEAVTVASLRRQHFSLLKPFFFASHYYFSTVCYLSASVAFVFRILFEVHSTHCRHHHQHQQSSIFKRKKFP